MRGCANGLLFAVMGAVVGAIIVTIIGWQCMTMRYPGFATDGQSAMIVFATFPLGGALGAFIGFAYGFWKGNKLL